MLWRPLCFTGVGASRPGVSLTLEDLPHPSPTKIIRSSWPPFPFSKCLAATALPYAQGHLGSSGIGCPSDRRIIAFHFGKFSCSCCSILIPCLPRIPLIQVLYMNNLTSNFYLESTTRGEGGMKPVSELEAGRIFASLLFCNKVYLSNEGRSFIFMDSVKVLPGFILF